MGFFSKLFGINQVVKTNYTGKFEISTELNSYDVEIRQKSKGLLPAIPIEAWGGYESPSGGFVNFGRFQVSGKNPSTKRKNKRTYEARDIESACELAKKSGLVEPFDVVVLPSREPTEGQLDYARSLGAILPEGACFLDVSAIISRITDDDESAASEKLAHYADEFGIQFSRYHGRKAIMNIAKSKLSVTEYSKFLISMPL